MTRKYLWGRRMREASELETEGLVEGQNYNTIYGDGDIVVIEPLSARAMRIMGSDRFAGVQAHWDISYKPQVNQMWKSYRKAGYRFAVVVETGMSSAFTKAVFAWKEGEDAAGEVYDLDDNRISMSDILRPEQISAISDALGVAF